MSEEQPYLRVPLEPPREWLEKLEERDDEEEQESENEHVVILQL
tara:strand:- start:3214 stop:3345 length:132 start_codon:yes stop_codon:yes gene_type:complete